MADTKSKEQTKSPSPKPDQDEGEVAPPIVSKGRYVYKVT